MSETRRSGLAVGLALLIGIACLCLAGCRSGRLSTDGTPSGQAGAPSQQGPANADSDIFGAVGEGDVAELKRLLASGVDPNTKGPLPEWTPLHVAGAAGQVEAARVLLEHKADVNAGDTIDRTPLYVAARSGSTEVAKVLLDHGADPNARELAGWTPLHTAAEHGHIEVARLLLEHKADINAVNAADCAPLYYAEHGGHTELANLLRQHAGGSGTSASPARSATADPAALVREGMAAKKRGDLQLAAAKFRQAIRADSGRADAHWGLAWVLVAQGQKAKAISEFLAVRRLSADAQMRQEAAAAIARLSNRTARAAPSPPPHPARQAHSSMPEAGDMAPEVSAAEWINVRKAPSLSSLRGGVVLIEFWATWCGPCKRAIPHLNEIHEKYKPKGLHVVSLTRENRQKVEQFMQSVPISYPVGLGSSSSSAYGVRGIPHAYLVGKDGEVLWHGHPASAEMEREVVAAL